MPQQQHASAEWVGLDEIPSVAPSAPPSDAGGWVLDGIPDRSRTFFDRAADLVGGVADVPRMLFEHVNQTGKQAAEALRGGKLMEAIGTLTAPAMQPFRMEGLPNPEQGRAESAMQAIELTTGAPVSQMKQAVQEGRPERAVGQGIGAALMMGGPAAVSRAARMRRVVPASQPTPAPVPMVPPGQPHTMPRAETVPGAALLDRIDASGGADPQLVGQLTRMSPAPRPNAPRALPERAASLDEFVPAVGGQVARRRDVLDAPSLIDGWNVTGIDAAPAPVSAPKGRKGKTAGNSMTVPARVMDREFEGAKVTREIYTSDPSVTADAPKVQMTPRERVELQRIAKELEYLPFTSHTFNEIPVGRGGSLEVTPGAAGAPVFNDILALGASGSRADVLESINKFLEGQHTASGQRALEVARGRLRGDPHLSRPMLPDDAGVRNQPLKGDFSDEDFAGFSAFLDDLAALGPEDAGGGRQPGQEGFIASGLLPSVGAGAAGGVVGGMTGDSAEERARNAALGATLGALAPVGVQRAARMLRVAPQGQPARIVGVAQPQAQRAVAVISPDGTRIPTTARKPAQPDTPLSDPMAGVDTFLEKFAPEIREGVKEVIERNRGFEAQRRGAVSQEQVEQLAQAVTVDVQRRVKPGTALNAEAIRSHVDALATAQSKVNELAAKVARGQNTDADVLALEAAKAEVNTIAASVMGARSEAGRALAQWRTLARVIDTGNPELMADAAQMLRGDAVEFARQFGQLPADPVSRYRWLQQQQQGGPFEKVRQYYYANILSGLKTHARNAVGNLANILTNVMVQPAAAGVDAARSRLSGQPRTVHLSEVPSQLAGIVGGVERGISEALFSLKHGVNRSALTQSLSAAEAGKLDVPRVEFGPLKIKGVQVLGDGGANPFNWPGRALDASDQFFRSIARNMEAHGLAHAQAKREGLTGDAFNDRVATLLAGIGEDGQRIAEQADKFARRAVFQEQAGPLVGALQAAAKRWPAVTFVQPFLRTPANILRQGFEFSPAGFAMKGARAGGREGAQAQARAALGSIGLAGLAWLAATGRLTGNGPNDPIERAQLLETGWRPNSVRIGDQWVQIALFQPISVPAMAVANAFEGWRERGMQEKDAATRAFEVSRRFGQSILDLSFMSGLADFFGAFGREGAMGAKFAEYAGRVASGFLPLAGAQRTVTQALDPKVRDTDGFLEQIQSGIPGLSDNLPARVDRWGKDLERPGGPVRRAADPFNVTPVNDDPVLAELGRLGVRVGRPNDRITGLALSRDQRRQVHVVKGQAGYRVLERLIASERYQRLSDEKKAEVIDKALDKTRSRASQALKPRLRSEQSGPHVGAGR